MKRIAPATMKTTSGTLAFAALAVSLIAADASAQDYRFGAGWNIGGSYFTSMNSGAGGGSEIALDPGWILGAQFESWVGSGRFGLRLNGAITQRPLSLPGGDRSIAVWLADFDGMVRFLPADPDRTFNIFLSAGAGFVQYRLGKGPQVAFVPSGAAFDGDDGPRFAAAGGLGADYVTSWRWDGDPIGIRFEVVDHVAIRSPFAPINESGDFSPVHNVRLIIGAFTGFGWIR